MVEVKSNQSQIHPYHYPVDLPFTLPTRIYTGMLVVWLLRPALQQRFPLHRERYCDYLGFLAWCTSIGRRQLRLLREIEPWNRELMRPVELPVLQGCQWQCSYTVGMYLAGISRAKYWSGQLMGNARMRHRAARWYFRDGRDLLGLPGCPDWQRVALQQSFGNAEQFVQTLLMPKDRQAGTTQSIREGVTDIVESWDKPVEASAVSPQLPAASPKLSQWLGRWLPTEANEVFWLAHAAGQKLPWRDAPSVDELKAVMSAVPVTGARSYVASQYFFDDSSYSLEEHQCCLDENQGSTERSGEAIEKNKGALAWGVNLVGYARGELGIGEDVRMMARSLEAAGVPFCIINVEPGAGVSQADTTAEHWIEEVPRYPVSMFCMTGIEMARMTVEKGLGWLDGRYNIGLWPWELPEWPEPWQHAWNLVDELWGISHYTADAYSRAPVPVHHMPMAVQIDQIADLGRKDWGLSQDAYLFVFSFDRNSTLSRKNPKGVVQAFQQAFGQANAKRANEDENENVGLVIKVSHLDPEDPDWQEVSRMMKGDSRIHLVYGEFRKDKILSLYRCCNAFVSLHRSEGFGRGMAEAQMLGLDLVVTGYSGNMDFCADNDTRLVDYQMVDVQEGEYFFGSGQRWAVPDIAQAAEQMKGCVTVQNNPGHFKYSTPDYPVECFSASVCGEAYRKRLEEVYQKLGRLHTSFVRDDGYSVEDK